MTRTACGRRRARAGCGCRDGRGSSVKTKWRKTITIDEYRYIYEHGYALNVHWIGPTEGYEIGVGLMGYDPVHFTKSARAAYNWVRRQLQAADAHGGAGVVAEGAR